MAPVLFCLHGLGLSGRSFDLVAAALAPEVQLRTLDLPGFGSAAAAGPATVRQMADQVATVIAEEMQGRPYLLAGHSMGGKIATVVASRALNGENQESGLAGLQGVVLLAGSPPSPEPMDEERREQMLGWVGAGSRLDESQARTFLDANLGGPLAPEADAMAMADLLLSDGRAWSAWLREGSREDWSDQVLAVAVPCLILAGEADGDLGETAQRTLNAPVYPGATVATLPGAGHLLTLERPQQVARQIRDFARSSIPGSRTT